MNASYIKETFRSIMPERYSALGINSFLLLITSCEYTNLYNDSDESIDAFMSGICLAVSKMREIEEG